MAVNALKPTEPPHLVLWQALPGSFPRGPGRWRSRRWRSEARSPRWDRPWTRCCRRCTASFVEAGSRASSSAGGRPSTSPGTSGWSFGWTPRKVKVMVMSNQIWSNKAPGSLVQLYPMSQVRISKEGKKFHSNFEVKACEGKEALVQRLWHSW